MIQKHDNELKFCFFLLWDFVQLSHPRQTPK